MSGIGGRFARLTFEVEAEDRLEMPAFKGSMLRGAFGRVFWTAVCVRRSQQSCHECTVRDCPYKKVFESADENGRPIPRPFAIEPPEDERRAVDQGESLQFGVTLFGQGLELAPLFVMLFDETGKLGVGRGRGRFVVTSVRDEFENIVYRPDAGFTEPRSRSIDEFVPAGPVKAASLRFVTPVVIRKDGGVIDVPRFEDLMDSLMRHLKLLYRFHASERIPQEVVDGVLNASKKVAIRKVSVEQARVSRFSQRQEQEIRYQGFTGEVEFTGEMTASYPWLKAGEYVHVGKGCTFGLGRFRIVHAH